MGPSPLQTSPPVQSLSSGPALLPDPAFPGQQQEETAPANTALRNPSEE